MSSATTAPATLRLRSPADTRAPGRAHHASHAAGRAPLGPGTSGGTASKVLAGAEHRLVGVLGPYRATPVQPLRLAPGRRGSTGSSPLLPERPRPSRAAAVDRPAARCDGRRAHRRRLPRRPRGPGQAADLLGRCPAVVVQEPPEAGGGTRPASRPARPPSLAVALSRSSAACASPSTPPAAPARSAAAPPPARSSSAPEAHPPAPRTPSRPLGSSAPASEHRLIQQSREVVGNGTSADTHRRSVRLRLGERRSADLQRLLAPAGGLLHVGAGCRGRDLHRGRSRPAAGLDGPAPIRPRQSYIWSRRPAPSTRRQQDRGPEPAARSSGAVAAPRPPAATAGSGGPVRLVVFDRRLGRRPAS